MGKTELKADLAAALENIQTAGNDLSAARNQERPKRTSNFGAVLATELENISNIIEALIDDSDLPESEE